MSQNLLKRGNLGHNTAKNEQNHPNLDRDFRKIVFTQKHKVRTEIIVN